MDTSNVQVDINMSPTGQESSDALKKVQIYSDNKDTLPATNILMLESPDNSISMRKQSANIFSMFYEERSSAGLNSSFTKDIQRTNCEIRISWPCFLEFTLYHAIYFFVLGPFINIFGIFSKKWFKLSRNMKMWGISSGFCYQTVFWILVICPILSFNLLHFESIHYVEVYTMAIITLSRCASIGSKYATINSESVRKLRSQVLSSDEISFFDRFTGWMKQPIDLVTHEIRKSMIRKEVDRSSWLLKFMVSPESSIQNQLKKVSDSHEDSVAFDCESVLELLLTSYKSRFSKRFRSLTTFFSFLAFVRAFVPSFYFRMFYLYNFNFEYLFGTTHIERLQICSMIIINVFFCYFSTTFMASIIADLERVVYLMTQLSAILSTRLEANRQEKKLLPTIDFTDPQTVRSWCILRKVAMDYGKEFYLRNKINITIALLQTLAELVYLLSYAFIGNLPQRDYVLFYAFGFDLIILVSFLSLIFLAGLRINKSLRIHKNHVAQIKSIVDDFRYFHPTYFGRDAVQPENIIYRACISKLRNRFTNLDTEELETKEMKKDLKTLSKITKNIIDNLTVQENEDPYCIMGIPLTERTANTGVWAIFTVSLAILRFVWK